MTPFTPDNAPGYSDVGLRNLNRAQSIIIREHGLDMDLPPAVTAEIDANLHAKLTNTHQRDLGVRMLLALWADD